MEKKYLLAFFFTFYFFCFSFTSFSQTCSNVTATYIAFESRCAATGKIEIIAAGGSGVYNYRVVGPISTPYTSGNIITGLSAGSYQVYIRDVNNNCTTLPDVVVVPGIYRDPRFELLATDVNCTGGNNGTITVTNQQYGTAPYTYTIVAPSASGIGISNSTGIFTGLLHGDYSIQLQDSCGGIQTRLAAIKNYTWNFQSSTLSKFTCDSASASIVLIDMNGNPNTSGIGFDNFLYGVSRTAGDTIWYNTNSFNFFIGTSKSVVFLTKDNCGTIKSQIKYITNVPSVLDTTLISNNTCSSFTATIIGQSNLTNPEYCLYNNSNVLLVCNTTGQFNNLAYGSYCIHIRDLCYDTTIVHCFTSNKPSASVAANAQMSSSSCSSFSVAITGQQNFTNANYCLYDNANILLQCNATGIFSNLAFGTYCVNVNITTALGNCYDTVIQRCFTINKNMPFISAAVTIYRTSCNTFNTEIQEQVNLTSPQFYLYSGSTLLDQNTNGIFTNLSMGSYCIDMQNGCGDTTIRRCFTVSPEPISMGFSFVRSCYIGHTKLEAFIYGGSAPFIVEIYDHMNNLVKTATFPTYIIVMDSLPALPTGSDYHVRAYDKCNQYDEKFIEPNVSSFTKQINITNNCPGGTQPFGSADLQILSNSNLGTVEPVIIKKGNTSVTITNNYKVGDLYDFYNLDPETYVIQYNFLNGCSSLYDTVVISSYVYPSINSSNTYQCDNNDFSVGGTVSGGLAPFAYEIIGSTPSSPSIVTVPQTNAIFNVSTNTVYSLVRLRTVDGCGNATLNDISVLSLGNISVAATSNCFNSSTTLSTDTVPTATYTWYKRIGNSDSTIVGNNIAYSIANLMPSDTGRYICKVSLNNGCVNRIADYALNGMCGSLLLSDEKLKLIAKPFNKKIELKWTINNEYGIKEYIIEKGNKQVKSYKQISRVSADNKNIATNSYTFTDNNASEENAFYRVSAITQTGKVIESNIVSTKIVGYNNKITFYPNPVANELTIDFGFSINNNYGIKIYTTSGMLLFQKTILNSSSQKYIYQRQQGIKAGIYILQVINTQTLETYTQRVVFE